MKNNLQLKTLRVFKIFRVYSTKLYFIFLISTKLLFPISLFSLNIHVRSYAVESCLFYLTAKYAKENAKIF